MGTNASYGGSNGKDWRRVRELWSGLAASELPPSGVGDGGGGGADPPPPGDVPIPADFVPSPALDALGEALADALGRGLPRAAAFDVPIASLLPRRGSGGGGGGGSGGGFAGGGGAPSGRSRLQIPKQAARGGAAIGAAVAFRDRDADALREYGITLAELDAMGPRQRNAAILDLVLGDAGHPDEAAVRAAALEQVKLLTAPEGATRTTLEALRAFIGELVVRIGLVELRDQILAKTASRAEVRRRETVLRQWVASKVHHLDLARYGSVSSRECHTAAARMATDALRLMRKKK